MNKKEATQTHANPEDDAPFVPWTEESHAAFVHAYKMFRPDDSNHAGWLKMVSILGDGRGVRALKLHHEADTERKIAGSPMMDPVRAKGGTPTDRGPGMWTEEEQSKLVRGLQEFSALGYPTTSTTQYLHLALHTFPGQRTVREMIQRVQAIQAAMKVTRGPPPRPPLPSPLPRIRCTPVGPSWFGPPDSSDFDEQGVLASQQASAVLPAQQQKEAAAPAAQPATAAQWPNGLPATATTPQAAIPVPTPTSPSTEVPLGVNPYATKPQPLPDPVPVAAGPAAKRRKKATSNDVD